MSTSPSAGSVRVIANTGHAVVKVHGLGTGASSKTRRLSPVTSTPSTQSQYVVHGAKSVPWVSMRVQLLLSQTLPRANVGTMRTTVFEAFIGSLKWTTIGR